MIDMKVLFLESEFDEAKPSTKLPLECFHCGKTFYAQKTLIGSVRKSKSPGTKLYYCSYACVYSDKRQRLQVVCSRCQNSFEITMGRKKKSKSGLSFCSQHCSGTYNALHKTHGSCRSKLELWLEQQLPKQYPNLQFIFNGKQAINSELDIHLPELNLAFELNGIFHYEPIFGSIKLSATQNNDERKFQACLERGIELVIIDSSGLKKFKQQNAQKYLDIIQNIINSKLESTQDKSL